MGPPFDYVRLGVKNVCLPEANHVSVPNHFSEVRLESHHRETRVSTYRDFSLYALKFQSHHTDIHCS